MTKQNLKADLEAIRLSELQARFAEATGEATRVPNRKFLVRRILEALEGGNVEKPAGDAGQKAKTRKKAAAPERAPEEEASDETATDDAEPKLSKLDVADLQVKYFETIGRETNSRSMNYLVWKIRQAQKGKVWIGPRARRSEGVLHKVLPIRIPASAVADLDECWKRLGLKSRTEFFRRAVPAYLKGAGETDTAALFAQGAPRRGCSGSIWVPAVRSLRQ